MTDQLIAILYAQLRGLLSPPSPPRLQLAQVHRDIDSQASGDMCHSQSCSCKLASLWAQNWAVQVPRQRSIARISVIAARTLAARLSPDTLLKVSAVTLPAHTSCRTSAHKVCVTQPQETNLLWASACCVRIVRQACATWLQPL